MKSWHHTLLTLFIGMIASAALFLIASPPRGNSVELLPAPSPAPMVVQVAGAVQNPGVYSLPPGSRVEQAIEAAGGFTLKANQGGVNLAARIRDGDLLTVPAEGTPLALPPSAETQPGKEKSAAPAAPTAPVNLNTATLEELQTLPGIGPTRAQDILDYRNAHGGFKSIDELQNVKGIGPSTFDKLKEYITVN